VYNQICPGLTRYLPLFAPSVSTALRSLGIYRSSFPRYLPLFAPYGIYRPRYLPHWYLPHTRYLPHWYLPHSRYLPQWLSTTPRCEHSGISTNDDAFLHSRPLNEAHYCPTISSGRGACSPRALRRPHLGRRPAPPPIR
jgi:hypothetical protein